MTMTDEKMPGGPSGRDLVEQLKAAGQLDALFAQIDAGQVELTGDCGFVPALVKAALERGLQGRSAWVTGMRRVDAPTRSDIDLVGWDARRDMVKLNPLAAWTDADVERFVEQEQVLLNPLRHDGYASIGCWPCTRPVDIGEDPRAGRWSGRAKTECGLHT